MPNSSAKTGDKFFNKTFLQGLTAVVLIYAGIFGWVAMQANKTLSRYEEKFPYRVVLIERHKEAYVYPPAPMLAPKPEEAQPEQQAAAPAPAQEEVVIPSGPLPPAPVEGLYETKADGKLPKISDAGQKPFDAYKRPYAFQGNTVIVLAVKDYGLSASDSDQALALPPEVSLILSPYAENPELWQKKAREAGHEVWLSLPMENVRFLEEDPGPYAMLSHSNLPENQKKLEKILGIVTGYAGLVGETDKAFLDMHAMLGELMTSVFARGLGYIELNPAGSEFLETMAVAQSAPFATVDKNGSIVSAQDLANVETLAQERKSYVTTVGLTPKNIETLREWTGTLGAKNISLAPLSAVASGKVPKKISAIVAPPPAPAITAAPIVTPAPDAKPADTPPLE